VPFPTAEWPVGDLPAGVDRAAIDAAVDAAFGAPDADARVRSVVIVQGGRVVYERYHPLDGPDVVFDSFSVAKSFTSALVGLLVADGTLTLDEHPPRPEWQTPGDPRQAITLRQLMQMSSGLEWTEAYGPGTTFATMLAGPNAAAVMAAQPLERPPGSAFEYSTGTTALISGIAADALGGCGAEMAALHTRLLDPLGITTEQLQTDQDGCFYGGFGANMTTRDFARFGLLYLRGGQWDGRQLLPTAWIDETRVPATTNSSYGLQWWLGADGASFAAEGLFGQRIVVIPGADLVIATTSTSGGDPYTMVGAIRAAFGVPEPPPATPTATAPPPSS
jgi:CubicO group peptidase (beta-lactamase class C family)